jgi:hypothetical protein
MKYKITLKPTSRILVCDLESPHTWRDDKDIYYAVIEEGLSDIKDVIKFIFHYINEMDLDRKFDGLQAIARIFGGKLIKDSISTSKSEITFTIETDKPIFDENHNLLTEITDNHPDEVSTLLEVLDSEGYDSAVTETMEYFSSIETELDAEDILGEIVGYASLDMNIEEIKEDVK